MTSVFTQSQVVTFIEKVFGEGKSSNGGLNISVVCPICASKHGHGYSKKKLVIRTDNWVSQCWVCAFKGRNILPLLKKFHPQSVGEFVTTFLTSEQLLSQVEEIEEKKEYQIKMPEGFQLLAQAKGKQAWWFKKYLRERGIAEDRDLWYWKFGFTEEDADFKDRIIIPSFDSEGKLNYWTARATKRGMKQKYLNPPTKREAVIFNELNIDWSKPVTVTEGPFDLLKCNENATCLLGSAINEEYLLFQKIVQNNTQVVLALDEDARDKAFEISKSFGLYSTDVSLLVVPKCFGDVGAMSKEQFTKLYKEAKLLTPGNFLSLKIKMLLNE